MFCALVNLELKFLQPCKFTSALKVPKKVATFETRRPLASHTPRSAFSWHCSKIKLFKSVTGGLLLSLLKPQGRYGRRRDYHSTKLYQGNSTDHFYIFLHNRYSISLNLWRNKKHKLKIR